MSERPAILMRRKGEALHPVSRMDAEELERFDASKTVRVRVTQPRNVGRFRLYWAALGLVHENMDGTMSKEKLHEAIKIKLGYCSTMRFKDGSIVVVADSVAFDAMPEAEFREFFDAFVDLVHTAIIPGVGKEALENEARLMLG